MLKAIPFIKHFVVEYEKLKAYNCAMREIEQYIGQSFTKRIDRWLRREDTWLEGG